ncbi:MAG TPA: CPBP family glutamic-type intramembrane protease [Planctomycetota bacterium]|nr:CPBP family glutamic-type intramembrane protease [Planctomycetota bacterium]
MLPFLLAYEIGLVLMPADVINGGDAIVMRLGAPIIKNLGVSGSFVSVLFIAAAFIVWQVRRKGSWKIRAPILATMFLESLFFAVLLFLMLQFFVQHVTDEPRGGRGRTAMQSPQAVPAARLVPCAKHAVTGTVGLRDFVLFCGAGVFEELVFRVMLLGLLMLVLTRLLHMEHAYAAAWSVALGAIIFSAFHHMGGGERFEWNAFIQRFFAGLYFSAIYFNRSFGVAAASHALYDILVGLNLLSQW